MLIHNLQSRLTYLSLLAALTALPLAVNGQETEGISRTRHGYPDFQGYWNNASQTPIERPTSLGDKRSYTLEEA
ncbi:hypothetical protein OAU36_05485, partial [Gammaproteobacteria bacterium]|nr:hypothetical protein [Gammaproteobacteria bacterium]